MPKFDATITLGALLTIVTIITTFIVAYTKATLWLANQFGEFKNTLADHAEKLADHTSRMDRSESAHSVRMNLYEQHAHQMRNDFQWLIGRMGFDRRNEERTPKE